MEYTNIPRPEYPRPQFVREAWMNLNGPWEHQTDPGQSGSARGLQNDAPYDAVINVPFCRESRLSGIGDVDFCDCVWYRKTVTLPEDWREGDRRTILHIGACDFRTTVWVNGTRFYDHVGGYVSFFYDITDALKDGDNRIVIRAVDTLRTHNQPAGKQCEQYGSYGCMYTRTTGIWQTVWLENVPAAYIAHTKYYPDLDGQKLIIEAEVKGGQGMTLTASASYEGKPMGTGSAVVYGGRAVVEVPLSELHLWEVGCGRLYDLELTLGEDYVQSYFGMRRIECRDGFFYLNGKPVFQRLVLDQGFYPDGIYTAPSLAELEADIDRSLAMGFNGARLHQKVFEPLFLSLCDKKGYIVWGEHGNWGLDIARQTAFESFVPEWCEVLARDFNHPAIIGWCPLNETQGNQNETFVRLLAAVTRGYDTTRMFIDTSGWVHVPGLTDFIDIHDYEQNPEVFKAKLDPLAEGGTYNVHWCLGRGREWNEHPTFVSEYGGIRWAPKESYGWGYGQAPEDAQAFLDRFKGLSEAILFNPAIGALCYTQLTDVEQEMNGLYTYDRKPKFDPAFMKSVLSQKAAFEKQ